MPNDNDKSRRPSDEELLANAIPIEGSEGHEPVVHSRFEEDPEHNEAIDLIPIDDDDVEEASTDPASKHQITHFGSKVHDDADANWRRKANVTGTGATHVRTFVSRMRHESLIDMDEKINAWLDQHPDYEVKFSVSAIGELSGKIVEPALVVQVWV